MLLKARPDTNAENPEYLAGMTECLSWLTDPEIFSLTHPRTGLHTVCKFLPTPADVHGFLKAIELEENRKQTQFTNPPQHHQKFKPDDPAAPWNRETDVQRKQRVVREYLGYNPSPSPHNLEPRRVLTDPTDDDMANLKLRTPAAPPSRYLIDHLEREGYPFTPPREASDGHQT